MTDVFRLLFSFVAGMFKSREHLEVENTVLRQQFMIAIRRARGQVTCATGGISSVTVK